MRSNLLGMCSVVATVAVAGSAMAGVQSYSTDFSNFNTGWFWQTGASSAGWGGSAQNGWSGNGTSGTASPGGSTHPNRHMVDAYIHDLGGDRGNVLRMSNATSSGNYETTHAAPATVTAAGETALGNTNNRFTYSLDFKAAAATQQTGLDLRLTAMGGGPLGRAMRHGQIGFFDDATNGFHVTFSDYVAGAFRSTILASNLDRNAWHSVSVDMTFNNGLANDVASVTLNGTTFSLTTWEQYYAQYASTFGGPTGLTNMSVDTFIFRASVTGNEALRGNGVYFDNFTMSSVPAPGAAALVGLASLVGGRRRRA